MKAEITKYARCVRASTRIKHNTRKLWCWATVDGRSIRTAKMALKEHIQQYYPDYSCV